MLLVENPREYGKPSVLAVIGAQDAKDSSSRDHSGVTFCTSAGGAKLVALVAISFSTEFPGKTLHLHPTLSLTVS